MASETKSMAQWVIEETNIEGGEWAELLLETPHLLFHEPIWARVLAEGVSDRIVTLLFKEGAETKAGAVGFIYGKIGIHIGYFSFPYGGIIGNPPADDLLRALLLEYGRRRGIAQMRIIGFPGGVALPTEGFSAQADQTHVLNLEGLNAESLWDGYKRNIRRDLRKAERSGVTVLMEGATVDAFYQLYLATMRRQNALVKYRREQIHAIVQHLVPQERASLMLAYRDEQPIAGILVVDSSEMSHYLMAGSDTESQRYQPNELLLHTAIERALRRGMRGFDFLPSGPGNTSLQQFKAKWGAEPVPLNYLTLVVSPARSFLWNTAYRCANWKPARKIANYLLRRS